MALGHEGTVAHNRRVSGGPIDPEVPVAVFRRPAAAAGRGRGDVVGVVTGYACHPVTLGADNRSVTRDYPGYVVDALEAHWPGSVALFFTGCCGQLNTGHAASDSWVARPTGRRTFAEARRLGELVARAAIDAVEGGAARAIDAAPLRVARRTVALPFDPPPSAPGADLARWRRALEDPAEAARWPLLRPQVAWAERVAQAPAVAVEEVEAACLAIGELAFAWFPGEIFVEHGLALKAEVAADGPVIAVSHAHAAPGYLPHPTAFAAGGYEVAEAFRFYGRPGPFSPAAGERLVATVADLVRRVRDRSDRGGDRTGPSHR